MKTYLKRFIPILILFFICGAFFGIVRQTNSISDKIVRFHIVANSNSSSDQKVKWEIRKEIFNQLNFENKNSKEEALAYFLQNSDRIKEISDSVLEKYNMPYKSTVYIGKKTFPIREYEAFTLPYGTYDTVSLNLGKREGENFFCVMYPSACIVSGITEKTDEIPELFGNVLTKKETELIMDNKEKTIVKFKIAEILKELLAK